MQSNINLWQELSKAKLIEGKQAKPKLESPWFIKLLLSISGWFGALFLVVAFGGFMSLTLDIKVKDFPFLFKLIF